MKKKEPSFKDRLARLQDIVTTLENGSIPLEESVALNKGCGVHAAVCGKQLEKARHDIRLCIETGTAALDTEEE